MDIVPLWCNPSIDIIFLIVGIAYIVFTFWTLSGISSANRSRSGPKSVHIHRSRADNVHEILGAIG